jgi:hypothetical protein
MDDILLKEYQREVARIMEDSLYSSKGHYNAADRWRRVHLWVGIPNAMLAAIAGLSAFKGAGLLAGSLAIAVAAITAINTFLNPGEISSTHKRCAGEYHSLRNRARIFINIVSQQNISPEELNAKFEELVAKRDDLNATSPQIPEFAYKKAKSGVDAGEADYKE